MKKFLIILIVATFILTALGGCGAKTGADNEEIPSAKETLAVSDEAGKQSISFDDEDYITWFGRVEHGTDGTVAFNYCATGFEVKFRGTRLDITLGTNGFLGAADRNYVSVMVDGAAYNPSNKYGVEMDGKVINVFADSGEHTVKLLKNTETRNANLSLKGLSTDGVFLKVGERRARFIEIYGDSITCGYGNIDNVDNKYGSFSMATEDNLQTYGFLTAEKLGAECSIMSASGHAILKSAFSDPSLPKDPITIPEMMTRKSYYNAENYVNPRNPQVVILNCGTNDNTYIQQGSTSAIKQQREDNYVSAYIQFIRDIRTRYHGVKIFICNGMLTEEAQMKPALERVIAGAGGSDITYVSLHNMWYTFGGVYGDIGADGHPGVKCHADAANILSAAIRNVMGW